MPSKSGVVSRCVLWSCYVDLGLCGWHWRVGLESMNGICIPEKMMIFLFWLSLFVCDIAIFIETLEGFVI